MTPVKISELQGFETGSTIDRPQLKAIGGSMPEMVLEILADFEANYREKLAELMDADSESSSEDWGSFFHSMKGAGGTLGLVVLLEDCSRLEKESKEGKIPDGDELKNLGLVFEKSCREARKFLKGLAS